jgi:hypothetical protein
MNIIYEYDTQLINLWFCVVYKNHCSEKTTNFNAQGADFSEKCKDYPI